MRTWGAVKKPKHNALKWQYLVNFFLKGSFVIGGSGGMECNTKCETLPLPNVLLQDLPRITNAALRCLQPVAKRKARNL